METILLQKLSIVWEIFIIDMGQDLVSRINGNWISTFDGQINYTSFHSVYLYVSWNLFSSVCWYNCVYWWLHVYSFSARLCKSVLCLCGGRESVDGLEGHSSVLREVRCSLLTLDQKGQLIVSKDKKKKRVIHVPSIYLFTYTLYIY